MAAWRTSVPFVLACSGDLHQEVRRGSGTAGAAGIVKTRGIPSINRGSAEIPCGDLIELDADLAQAEAPAGRYAGMGGRSRPGSSQRGPKPSTSRRTWSRVETTCSIPRRQRFGQLRSSADSY